jgi:sortase A
LIGLAYYGFSVSNEYVYQVYQNWAFDQQIAGRPAVTFGDYLRERTPFGFLAGERSAERAKPGAKAGNEPFGAAPPPIGAVLGRVEIPRLDISAIVRQGVDADVLSKAVGHVPSTALAGATGNFAIAAHRDTLFRGLKDIQIGDLVKFQSPAGSYTYKVAGTRIVLPSDISVLRADGGGVIPVTSTQRENADRILTMITCYPFYYVGSAPKRFIVEAQLVSKDPNAPLPVIEAKEWTPPKTSAAPRKPPRPIKRASLTEPRAERGFSHLRRLPRASLTVDQTHPVTPKKHNFLRRLLHF